MAGDAAPLMVSVSGVRGIAGRSITPALVVKYVSAFGRQQLELSEESDTTVTGVRPSVVLGRDSRVSGPWIESIAQGVLQSCGLDVHVLGVVPTPTVQLMVLRESSAVGGLVVTSSHNPEPWNGLKFIGADGLFLSPDACATLFAAAAPDAPPVPLAPYDCAGEALLVPDAPQRHIDECLSLPYIPVEDIRARAFKVVLDTVNGAGGPTMGRLLESLGCTVVPLNLEASGRFAHTPEPVPENLGQLCAAVAQHSADLGIAVDPDVDRCVLIDEKGEPLGEEYTLGIAVEFILGTAGKRGAVCRNLSSSRLSDDIAAKYGCKAYQSPVGEIHVAQEMLRVNAVIGGEGNGGVMLPDVHIGRDAPVAATLVLAALAKFGGTISALKASLPQYEIVKQKVPLTGVADADAVLRAVKEEWANKDGARVDERDGIRVDYDNWWVHMRKSNTEPVLRIIGEAPTAALALERCEAFAAYLK